MTSEMFLNSICLVLSGFRSSGSRCNRAPRCRERSRQPLLRPTSCWSPFRTSAWPGYRRAVPPMASAGWEFSTLASRFRACTSRPYAIPSNASLVSLSSSPVSRRVTATSVSSVIGSPCAQWSSTSGVVPGYRPARATPFPSLNTRSVSSGVPTWDGLASLFREFRRRAECLLRLAAACIFGAGALLLSVSSGHRFVSFFRCWYGPADVSGSAFSVPASV